MKKPTAAFQGELGAFSQIAVHQLLGDDVKLVPCPTFDDVFRRLSDKRVGTAVIPIENTLHGSIHENYDHLLEFGLAAIQNLRPGVEKRGGNRLQFCLAGLAALFECHVQSVLSNP